MMHDDMQRLQRDGQVPVWRQIETDLAVEIRNGLIAPGEKLPSEHELSQRYGVNRHTARVALARLASDGLVVAQRGRGVFVVDEMPVEYRLDRDAKWSQVEEQLNASPSGTLIGSYTRPATKRIAQLLDVVEGADMIVTESSRQASHGIATYGYHFFEKSRFEGIDRAFASLGSFTAALAEYGYQGFFRSSTWIDCRMPRTCEAEALNAPLEAPVLVMMYVDCDRKGRPLLFGSAVIPAGRMLIRVDTL